MDIEIGKITVDVEIVGRVSGLDSVTVQTYADDMEAGVVFPPVELVGDGDVFWLVDGQHRLEAARQINGEQISANVTKGDRWDALEMSAANNAEHGKPRTNEEKRQSVLMLLEGERWSKWSNHEIAGKCKVSDPFVMKLRNLTTNVSSEKTERTYITKHGTLATMNTTNIGGNNKGHKPQQSIISRVTTNMEQMHMEQMQQKPKQMQQQIIKPAVKELWCQYASLLLRANVISKTIVVNYDEYDIRVTLEDDSFLRESIGKAMDVNLDFAEGVKNGFQSKSN